MNIATVLWPVNQIGGISTWSENFISGARKIGHRVQTFYCTPSKRFKCDKNKKLSRGKEWSTLPAQHISYHPDLLKDTIDTLNEYDVIVFLHPSPHPTKSQLDCLWADKWQVLYSETVPKKISVFHDSRWKDNNHWAADVAPYLDKVVAAQPHFRPCVDKYPADCEKITVMQPFDLERAKLWRMHYKENSCFLGTQWVGIKNHKKFVPQLSDIKIPVELFGCGIEYFYIRLTKLYKESICIDIALNQVLNPNAIHNYRGYVEYEVALKALSYCRMSIDLSTNGYINMTHWEPMLYGVISLVEERAFDDPYCMIPDDCCLIYDLPCAASAINAVSKMSDAELKPIIDQSWKFIQKFDSKLVAAEILKGL